MKNSPKKAPIRAEAAGFEVSSHTKAKEAQESLEKLKEKKKEL